MRTLTIALLLLFVPTMSIAYDGSFRERFDGNELKEFMDYKDSTRFQSGFAQGFVMGLSIGLSGIGYFCPPPGSIQGQGYDVVKKYLEDHPENRHESAAVLAMDALRQSFPCEK